jgi:tripartite-type tricarboxylate transporter receptor subunit TctC
MMDKGRRAWLRLAAAAAAAAPLTGWSQDGWPSRPIRFVIPFPPGGGGDVVARAVAERVSETLKQSVIVDNRTGGNAVIAASIVAQAAHDGYTYLWDGNNHLTNKLLVKDIPFDYRAAFVPVTLTARFPQVLAVRKDFPAADLDAFVAHARANPGRVSVGTPPSGGMGHLALELLQRRAEMKLVHTPYRGGPDAVRDLMGSQIDAVFLTTSTIRPALQGDKARLLAVSSLARSPLYPGVPTFAEKYPGFDMDDWNGLFAPAGTPEAIVARMNAAVQQAVRDAGLQAKLSPTGTVVTAMPSTEFVAWLDRQRATMERIIRESSITLTA